MRASFVLFVLAVCVLSGCETRPNPTPPPAPPSVEDVHWLALVRDHQTATAYTGRTVRIRLARGEFAHEAGELRVWFNDRQPPPVLILKLREPLPPDASSLVVVGVCRGPTRDGVRRNLTGIDYYVVCDECSATAAPR